MRTHFLNGSFQKILIGLWLMGIFPFLFAQESQSLIEGGIEIRFETANLNPKRSAGEYREGDPVRFRFTIRDTLTNQPMSGAYPAAWMGTKSPTKAADPCVEKIQAFLSGSLMSQAELDLNVYYVLALNNDSTITVVDPLFGFGGTKLLAMIQLPGIGMDWVQHPNQQYLYVSIPGENAVAVISTATWSLTEIIDIGYPAYKLGLQPDLAYLWVGYENESHSGVAAIRLSDAHVVQHIETGKGWHDMVFREDSRYLYVSNKASNTVSAINTDQLELVQQIQTGEGPVSIDYSPMSQAVFVSNQKSGTVTAIDAKQLRIRDQLSLEAGLTQLRCSPNGRQVMVLHTEKNLLHIIDASNHQLVQTGDMEALPSQINFSDELAYITHRGSETVLMIPLDELGIPGRPVPVIDFPGGDYPPGKSLLPSAAPNVVQAPGANAVLVANPMDESIYFYREGMAAPMGNFSNYNRQPRAVLAVDKSLNEVEPGVYETVAPLPHAGKYDVVFFLDVPRITHCFDMEIYTDEDMQVASLVDRMGPLLVMPMKVPKEAKTGESVSIEIKLFDPASKSALTDLEDVQLMATHASGIWHQRKSAILSTKEHYTVEYTFPESGIYYIYAQCLSKGLSFNNPQFFLIQVL